MIRRQVVLPVAPDRLWEALTDPDQASGWLGGRMEWEVAEGAQLRFHDDDGSQREGQVDAVRTGRYLRYRWWTVTEPGSSGDDSGGDGDGESDAAEVTYIIEPDEEGARLTIQERGLPTGVPAAHACLEWTGPGDTVTSFSWSRWDDRMIGAWAGLSASVPARASA